MKKTMVLMMILTAAAVSLFACSSCPAPRSAPGTYSSHSGTDGSGQK